MKLKTNAQARVSRQSATKKLLLSKASVSDLHFTEGANKASYNHHLICNDSQLKSLVKSIIKLAIPKKKPKRVTKKKPSKSSINLEREVSLFLLNCNKAFVFCRDDHALNLSKLRDHCNVSDTSRYPELRQHPRNIKKVLDFLFSRNIIRQKIGKADIIRDNGQWVVEGTEPTVITPSDELVKFVDLCKVESKDELIQIKQDVDGDNLLVDYLDTSESARQRQILEKFNHRRTKHTFSVFGDGIEFKDTYRLYRAFDVKQGKSELLSFDDMLLSGGRFQGGVTKLPRTKRSNLLMDGEETCIVDFCSMFISLAYQKSFNTVVDAPYDVYGSQSKEFRAIIKKICVIALGISRGGDFTPEEQIMYALKGIIDEDIKDAMPYSDKPYATFEPELPIPNNIYQDIGTVKGDTNYYIQGCPDADAARVKCEYSLSRMITDTIKKHEKLLNKIWDTPHAGLFLQKYESNIMFALISHNKTLHTPQRKMFVKDSKFCICDENYIPARDRTSFVYESWKDENMFFEPIHDGILTKVKWAKQMKDLMELEAKNLGFDLTAEIEIPQKLDPVIWQ